jgi:hypothetical protein
MGLRIYKAIGYGIDNLKYRKVKGECRSMTDPRVNWDKLRTRQNEENNTSLAHFWDWAKHNQELLTTWIAREQLFWNVDPAKWAAGEAKYAVQQLRDLQGKRDFDHPLYQCVKHDEEFGLPEVMLIIPPNCHDWVRYDDTIDYEEEKAAGRSCQPWAKRIAVSGGIHPYNSRMQRVRDPGPGVYHPEDPGRADYLLTNADKMSSEGIWADEKGLSAIHAGLYSQLTGLWDPDQKPQVKGVTLKHFQQDWRPALPPLVVALVLWADCFPDPKAFLDDLRPLLYVWWS